MLNNFKGRIFQSGFEFYECLKVEWDLVKSKVRVFYLREEFIGLVFNGRGYVQGVLSRRYGIFEVDFFGEGFLREELKIWGGDLE